MSTRVMPFRGSVTSREQVSVYEFGWPAILLIPLIAILIQIFIPVKVRFMPIIDLPFLVKSSSPPRGATPSAAA